MASNDQRPSDPVDLELSLAPLDRAFVLRICLSRPGDAADLRRGPCMVTFDATTLPACALDPAAYGAALRDALLADPDALAAFAEARAVTLADGRRLRVRLLLPPELQPLRYGGRARRIHRARHGEHLSAPW
jgi:hypothetical protein